MSTITKEQLIAHITPKLARIKPHKQVNDNLRNEALMNKRVLEIALAALTAEPVKYAANGSLFSQIGVAEVAARSYGVPVEPLYHSPIEGLE